jgi:hypothetical protein
LIDLFTKHNGSAPTVEQYSDEQYEQDTDVPGFAMVAATYKKRWGEGKWGWESYDAEWIDVPVGEVTLEESSKPAFAK